MRFECFPSIAKLLLLCCIAFPVASFAREQQEEAVLLLPGTQQETPEKSPSNEHKEPAATEHKATPEKQADKEVKETSAKQSKKDAKETAVAKPAAENTGATCQGFGPQTPRDIDNLAGNNKRMFSLAPSYREMNLCNMHFHQQAEHKAKDFSIVAKADEHGHGGGYQCSASKTLSAAELKSPAKEVCHGLKPGDTIEVHWVYSSCDVQPGKGLESCMSANCTNPDLRVESQVFLVVNDDDAININDYAYAGQKIKGYFQAKALPANTGKAVVFAGSTTGPKYSDQTCSPLQVTWSVRPQCARVSINSLATWCEENVFEENHGHGVRKLVTDLDLLSEID